MIYCPSPPMRTLLCLVFTALALPAQEPVRYALSFPNAVHHEAEVRATFTGVRQPTLEVLISRSSPGRYSLHEFPKNVYNLKATDGPGSPPHGVPTFRLPMEHLRSQGGRPWSRRRQRWARRSWRRRTVGGTGAIVSAFYAISQAGHHKSDLSSHRLSVEQSYAALLQRALSRGLRCGSGR